ncbi:MAG: cupin [candidate division NC10 bacterium RIFCSPLOWO2_12_FULL_66_18]|nr:MAG: cupin [candidate division NC10 bacterium RIFCSPLOWO2_12_FULL_66_18]
MTTASTPQTQLPPAKPMALVDAVQYAPGSVVSRTLLKSDAGTLTLFAFDEGQELSEHTAPFDALVQVLDGTATLRIGGTTVSVGTGELVLMPADVPHAVQAAGRFKMLLTMFRAGTK